MKRHPSPIQDAKRQWRHEFRRRLSALTEEARCAYSTVICERLCQLPQWTAARSVLLFYSQPHEPNILPLWRIAAEADKLTAFPSFQPASRRYVARTAPPWKPEATLPMGAFGIPEPLPTAPLLDGNQLDFVVVPGVGFTPDGRRLGRGGGYYDRLLTEVKGFRCGVAFDEQLVDHLPTEPHDIRCDCILTPSHEWVASRART